MSRWVTGFAKPHRRADGTMKLRQNGIGQSSVPLCSGQGNSRTAQNSSPACLEVNRRRICRVYYQPCLANSAASLARFGVPSPVAALKMVPAVPV